MEDWMFDIESVDAAIAAGTSAANNAVAAAAALTADGNVTSNFRMNAAAAAAAIRSASAGSIDHGQQDTGVGNAGRLRPPQPAAAVAQQPLGLGGHMSMSAHDFSTITGTTNTAVAAGVKQHQHQAKSSQLQATAVVQAAESGATTVSAALGTGARTDAEPSAAQGQPVTAGNSAPGVDAETGADLHFDMSLSELETFDFDLYDS